MDTVQVIYSVENLKAERLEYVLAFLNKHPLNDHFFFTSQTNAAAKFTIAYGMSEGEYIVPVKSVFLSDTTSGTTNLQTNSYTWKRRPIHAVETEKKVQQFFFRDHRFGFDIFNTIFFHISRYEEVFAKEDQLGQAGWLREDQHYLIKQGLQDRPVVDELVLAFLQALGAEINTPKTTYDISHDVDILGRFTPFAKWIKSLGATIFYQRGLQQLKDSYRYYTKMKKEGLEDPYDSFDYLLRAERVWQSKHIYFMAGGNTKYDNHYQLSDPRLDKIIRLAKDRGYEIGIHPSYNAGFDGPMYQKEKKSLEEKIGKRVNINRQHWLRFSWQKTPGIWAQNDITQDATMGYNRFLGFRCGTGFAYHMYDFKRERAYEWKEQPMAFMESSAIHRAKSSGVELSELIKNFLRQNKYGTHISFNFHNSNFDPLLETGRMLSHFYQNELLDLLEAD